MRTFRRHRARALAALLPWAAACAAAPAASEPGRMVAKNRAEPAPDESPSCIRWTKQARWANYGYDHLVHIKNGCSSAAKCSVTTNVRPQAVHVTVPVQKTVTVVTFRGSPASEFTAQVTCTLAAAR